MNLPLLACLTFGVFIIIARGPFIFWPDATASFYRDKVFKGAARVRMLAAIPFFIGLILVLTTSELQNGFAFLSTALGLMLLAACGILILVPNDMSDLVTTMMDLLSDNLLRGMGVLSVAFAVGWIYAAFVYLAA
jgi:hypothetical protein